MQIKKSTKKKNLNLKRWYEESRKEARNTHHPPVGCPTSHRRIRQQKTICTSANEEAPAGYPATEVCTDLAGAGMSGERTAGAGCGGGSAGRSPCVDCPQLYFGVPKSTFLISGLKKLRVNEFFGHSFRSILLVLFLFFIFIYIL